MTIPAGGIPIDPLTDGAAMLPFVSDEPRLTASSPEHFRPLAAWCSVAILLVFSLFAFLDRQIIALLVDPIKADLGLNDSQLGLLQGLAFALLYSLAGLPIGWAVDRYPRRVIIYLGITIWSLSSAACGLALNFWHMFLGRTFVGIGEASLTPAAVSLISDIFPRDRVATPLGIYTGGFYLGSGIALAIGGWIIGLFAGSPMVDFPLVGEIAAWQAAFIVTGLPGAAAAFLAFLIFDPRPANHLRRLKGARPNETHFSTFLRSRWKVIGFGFGGFSIANFVNYAISAWTPAYFMRVFGWSAADTGWAYGAVVALSGAAGAFTGGTIMDRVYRSGRTDSYFLVAGISATIAPLFLVGAYLVASPIIALVGLCIGMTLLGVIAAGCYSTWQKIAPPAFRGRLTALFILVGALTGAGLGPLAVGLLTDFAMQDELMVGYSIAIIVGIFLPMVAAFFFAGRSELRALPT